MTLRVVGAGVARTGTNSLKLALEQLLGGPCYHMLELFDRPDDVAFWQRVAEGYLVDWRALFGDYRAAVDWPASAAWQDLATAYPDSLVLLSTRASADTWWQSAEATVVGASQRAAQAPPDPVMAGWGRMMRDLIGGRFCADLTDRDAMIAAYERHNASVRSRVPGHRLVDWQPGDGWEPLCRALGVPVPDVPFPHVNTTSEFRGRAGMDAR